MYILTFIVDIFFLSIWKHFICLYTWFIKLWTLLWFLSQKLEWEYFSIDLLPYQDIFLDVNVSNSQKGCNKKDEDGAKRVLLLISFFFFFCFFVGSNSLYWGNLMRGVCTQFSNQLNFKNLPTRYWTLLIYHSARKHVSPRYQISSRYEWCQLLILL